MHWTPQGVLISTHLGAVLEHVDRDVVVVDARRRRVYAGESQAASPTAYDRVRGTINFTRAFAAVAAVVVALRLVVAFVAVTVADAVDLGWHDKLVN